MLFVLIALACRPPHGLRTHVPGASFAIGACEVAPASRLELNMGGTGPSGWSRITLWGAGFYVSALDPEITIGDVRLLAFEIQSGERIVGYLSDPPPPRARVEVTYRGATAVGRPTCVAEAVGSGGTR